MLFTSADILRYAVIQDAFGYRVMLVGDGFTEHGTISGGITAGVWYHWAVTRTGGQIRAYFNGNYETGDFGAAPADMGGPDEPLYIGSNAGADGFHNGWIDSVRMECGRAIYTGTGTYTIPTTEPVEIVNNPAEQRRGLNTLNGHALGGSPAQAKGLVAGWLEPETRQPLAGSLLYPLDFLSFQTLAVRLRVHIRDKVVLDTVVYNERVIRLPTGFKSDIWQFEMLGNTHVYSLQVATTPRQLKAV
jgi:hypothetical protein